MEIYLRDLDDWRIYSYSSYLYTFAVQTCMFNCFIIFYNILSLINYEILVNNIFHEFWSLLYLGSDTEVGQGRVQSTLNFSERYDFSTQSYHGVEPTLDNEHKPTLLYKVYI